MMNTNPPIFWKSPEDREKKIAESRQSPGAAKAKGEERNTDVSYPDGPNRREFLQWMSAITALVGTSACSRQPMEKIVPYQKTVEEIVPGVPLFYATAVTMGGVATGVLVESHMGRPTKIEGNPDHPGSLGSTNVFQQAAILDLYDPDRSSTIRANGMINSWMSFRTDLKRQLAREATRGGSGVRLVTETITSPTLGAQIRSFLGKYPKAQWVQYEPLSRDNVRAGARLAFGSDVETRYHFDQAEVILAIDSDFLLIHPASVRYARDFSRGRRVTQAQGGTKMNRLYAIESTPTLTGAKSDHRLLVKPSQMERLVNGLAAALGLRGAQAATGSGPEGKWIAAVAADLKRAGAAGLVVAGESQSPAVHALVHAINAHLGSVGKTVTYSDPIEAAPQNQFEALQTLVRDMQSGAVSTLILLAGNGANPVFTAPADLKFAEAMAKVPWRAHLGLYMDETASLCGWHVNATHELESWGDALCFDGTATVQQPLIAPLYDGKTAYEVLDVMNGGNGTSAHDLIQAYWKTKFPAVGFEKQWRRILHDGVVPHTRLPEKKVALRGPASLAPVREGAQAGYEIVFRPDPTIYDGRYANNGWLQELAKPLTKLTWDNAAQLSPKTANELLVKDQDLIEITFGGRKLIAPALIVPGQADGVVSVSLGYGRTKAGRIGTGTGFNAYAIRTLANPWTGAGVEIKKHGGTYRLALTHEHFDMEGRDIVRTGKLAEYTKNPSFLSKKWDKTPPAQLMPVFPIQNKDYQWGMVIDMNACIGCNACVVGCQSENNIPVVGKDQVERYREMHWIRVDRYYTGNVENPQTHFQPVPCMHCENAPCELVCPVGATNHSDDGINQMVYNRCVGTRYCSNNCPYKVRRFNFYLYGDQETPQLKMHQNPDVTVRTRGVMEKCTYCIQRINEAKISAEKESRKVRDGEIVTACQQACPTQAIFFGNLADPTSQVAKMKAEPLNYGTLEELNTRPRTSYIAEIKNPNPQMVES